MQDIGGAITVWRLVPEALTFVTPMAARLVKALPESSEWLYEPKLDGYRALLLKDGERIQILSRNEKTLRGCTRLSPRPGFV
jgi:ATP-dependent DNA ligase